MTDTLADYQMHTASDYDPLVGITFNKAMQDLVWT